jgi:hypothetical protein
MVIARTPYERVAEIDVGSQLENLRRHYAKLQHDKELKGKRAEKKAMHARPSETQLRLYREGVHKISTLKMDEELERAQFTAKVRCASPSPICDRLYEQGLLKVLARRTREDERKKEAAASPYLRRKATGISSPVCDRLYQQGVDKVKAERSSSRTKSDIVTSPSIRSASPNRTCDRLYNHGKQKIRSARSRSNTPLRSQDELLRKLASSPSKRSNSIDRMYENGKAKLRSTSQPRRHENTNGQDEKIKTLASTSATTTTTTTTTVRAVSPNLNRLYEKGKANYLPPTSTASQYKVVGGSPYVKSRNTIGGLCQVGTSENREHDSERAHTEDVNEIREQRPGTEGPEAFDISIDGEDISV